MKIATTIGRLHKIKRVVVLNSTCLQCPHCAELGLSLGLELKRKGKLGLVDAAKYCGHHEYRYARFCGLFKKAPSFIYISLAT